MKLYNEARSNGHYTKNTGRIQVDSMEKIIQ